jgi:murein DD-endopeptidase MepM/ murein hydrolase activator NlpD
MRLRRVAAIAAAIALAALAPSTRVRADDDVARGAPALRWSDGPRDVPRPRGASAERARALGLGTRETATHLLTRPPEARWVAAARGRKGRPLLWPVDGARFGRGFGFVRRERTDLPHRGIDVAGAPGAPVRAVGDGIVAYSDNGVRGFGNCVMIVHPDGLVSLYAHLARATVQAGWRVTRGERIGLVGATGIARGPHLHFELREQGRVVDPEPRFAAIPGRPPRGPGRVPAARPTAPAAVAAAAPAPRLQRGCGRGTSEACRRHPASNASPRASAR